MALSDALILEGLGGVYSIQVWDVINDTDVVEYFTDTITFVEAVLVSVFTGSPPFPISVSDTISDTDVLPNALSVTYHPNPADTISDTDVITDIEKFNFVSVADTINDTDVPTVVDILAAVSVFDTISDTDVPSVSLTDDITLPNAAYLGYVWGVKILT